MRPVRELDQGLLWRGVVATGVLACLLAGCSVKVDKSKDGENKNVDIRLPLGGLHVEQNATTAQDLGLPAYPGAMVRADGDDSKSADVRVGWGDWQLHVRSAKYQTADPQAKVLAYYRDALGRYGSVLECRDGVAVGAEHTTHEGLSCDDKHPGGRQLHLDMTEMTSDLRAGSRRHEHIVGIGATGTGQTAFTLVAIDLPAGLDKENRPQ